MIIFILINNCVLSLAPYLASQPLDSSLLTQPNPSPSSSQSSSTQLSSSTSSSVGQQSSTTAAGPTVPNSSSNAGSGNSSASTNNLVTTSGQSGPALLSAKANCFPSFGSMSSQGQGVGPQSGQLGQQAGTQNAGSSGDNSSSQAQGPSEPPERYASSCTSTQHLNNVIEYLYERFTPWIYQP